MKSCNEKGTHVIVVHFLLKPKLVACNDLIPTSKHCSTLCKLRELHSGLWILSYSQSQIADIFKSTLSLHSTRM
jgi:hypothetical protein